MTTVPVIDAHQHVWDPARARYDWLGPEFAPIDRKMSFEDLESDLATCGVTHTIQVQSADNPEDTTLMIESAAAHPQVVGIVGFAPIESPAGVAKTLEAWAGDSLLVGVRALIHNQPDPDYLLRDTIAESLNLLAIGGLSFDVVAVLPRHLELVSVLAERHPELRLVIDHLAKPPIGRADQSEWKTLIRRAAEHPNVYAKVSGLYSSVGALADWTTDTIRPAFEHALDCFGASRLMYGGDWPISVLAGGYRRMWAGLQPLFDTLGPAERDRLLSGTAQEFYRLDPVRLGAGTVT